MAINSWLVVALCILPTGAAEEQTDKAAALVLEARAIAKAGDAEKADAMLQEAHVLNPQSGEPSMYRANIKAFLVKDDFETAVALYKESISADPTRWEPFYFLGKVLTMLRRYDEAEDELQAALKLVPDNGAVKAELGAARTRRTLGPYGDGSYPTLPDDPQLTGALEKNIQEHDKEIAESCANFYCGTPRQDAPFELPRMERYDMGPVPSNDFPASFNDKEEQIYVTSEPLFTPEECNEVIELAEKEGNGLPAAASGKYQIGKGKIKDMPAVLSWFNQALEKRLYPTLAALFPGVVSGASMLRAHSVLVVKYNGSDTTSRSDVHVDDALLAFTIALSPTSAYEGGGTFFEHLGRNIDMAQGHATFRPGSVRHAGASISSGLRYIIGGFIALEDKIEHVRRLVERGQRILLMDDAGQATPEHLVYAVKLFRWGLLLNNNCTLCHQSLGDVLLRLGEAEKAETSLRSQIRLLPHETDAYFSLGVSLKKQKRHGEAVNAYEQALDLNPEDAECYINLASALSEKGDHEAEASAYRAALSLDPSNAVGWLNLGGTLAHDLRKPQEAIDVYRKAATAFEVQGKDDEAKGHFRVLAQNARREKSPEYAPLAAALHELAQGNNNAQHNLKKEL